jgi:hypothetical protein
MDATDGLAAAHVPAARSKGPKALPTKPPKVVPARKSKKAEQAAAPEDTELAEQMAIEQAGRNSHGIEGRENLHASYLAEAIAQRNMMSKLRMKWATRVADFRNQGVNTRAVNAIIKELGDDADSSVAWHNVMNQLRAMVGLPAFGTLELPSLVKGDAERDALAEEEAKRCAWRGGSEKDCQYGADTVRGQKWITKFREERAKLEGVAPPGALKHFNAA